MRRKGPITLFALLLMLMLVVTGCGQSAPPSQGPEQPAPGSSAPASEPAEPIVLRAVSFLPVNHSQTATLQDWVDSVEAATDGKVKVNWLGGPEIIGSLDQIEAVRSGAMDIIFNVTGYYESLAPELRAFSLSPYTPWEERENGFYDLMVERHKQLNTMYLGRWLSEQQFYLWLRDPISDPSELTGMRLRSVPTYDRFFKDLGAVPVTVETPEVYTALERGMVDGLGWPNFSFLDLGWSDYAKYQVDHPMIANQNAAILVNLDRWNEIPAQEQQAILQATAEYEHRMVEHFAAAVEAERQEREQLGIKTITFSPEAGRAFEARAEEVQWEYIRERVPAELFEEVRQLIKK